ncbi:DUF2268 domain-containing putative Zn-dependent protease [Neobacillus niacini]|uniref:DUF2268 domain-containing protein n=1 Tax=Neobacillus niacini TaxID=86668 RepID=UPI0007ABFD86|nr:DUF2268 domain-containing putative Zn-dependent protease [Neobacillus niacini]MEC1523995.1 DUF2268 domain-containing putative Zn-dependent protease [Neobacillus niacini]
MGIIRTDKWLEDEFDRPLKICEKLLPVFKGQSASKVYNQLIDFGMYRASRRTEEIFNAMKDNMVWQEVEGIFQEYKKKWGGPDIPIYIFPIGQSRSFFFRQEDKVKGGVSYPDKMFLFLSDSVPSKELEALFVHEYHHICRLNKQTKRLDDYTLLDSIIIEGLAEYSVLIHCGKDYLADWCKMYSEAELDNLWEKFLQGNLDIKKSEKKHDDLLYGSGKIPRLLGYAVGFKIVEDYYRNYEYSTKLSFTQPAKKYLITEQNYTKNGRKK